MFEQVKEIMLDTTSCSEEKMTLSANLKEDLELDSLDAVELGMALEEHFGIEIPAEDMQKFVTIGDIVEYLGTKVA